MSSFNFEEFHKSLGKENLNFLYIFLTTKRELNKNKKFIGRNFKHWWFPHSLKDFNVCLTTYYKHIIDEQYIIVETEDWYKNPFLEDGEDKDKFQFKMFDFIDRTERILIWN